MGFKLKLVKYLDVLNPVQILTEPELKVYNLLKIDKRKTDWLAGRYAAKQAVMEMYGGDLSFFDIEIENNEDRSPFFKVKGVRQKNDISISHSRKYAVSVVSTSLVGVDIEIIEKRSTAWAKEVFALKELKIKDETTLTQKWTQKEAVLKLLKLGLKADLHKILIMDNKPVLLGKILERYKKLTDKSIELKSFKKPNGFITTVAFARVH